MFSTLMPSLDRAPVMLASMLGIFLWNTHSRWTPERSMATLG